MRKRSWLVEDNLAALYIALYGAEDLPMSEKEITRLLGKKDFSMRVRQFIAIETEGKSGLKGGLKSPLFKKLHKIFKRMDRKIFEELVNLILTTRNRIRISNDRSKVLL